MISPNRPPPKEKSVGFKSSRNPAFAKTRYSPKVSELDLKIADKSKMTTFATTRPMTNFSS